LERLTEAEEEKEEEEEKAPGEERMEGKGKSEREMKKKLQLKSAFLNKFLLLQLLLLREGTRVTKRLGVRAVGPRSPKPPQSLSHGVVPFTWSERASCGAYA